MRRKICLIMWMGNFRLSFVFGLLWCCLASFTMALSIPHFLDYLEKEVQMNIHHGFKIAGVLYT